MKEARECPVLERQIDEMICSDIQSAAAGAVPAWTMSEDVLSVEGFEDICLHCRFNGTGA